MQAELPTPCCRVYTMESHRQAVERVILAMREHLDEFMSLKDMAKIAYISHFQFNRIFHQITGIPPVQFLYALRLNTAKQLLLMTDRSVTDVCYEVGYNSLGTFTTRFTQLVGVSPRRLRRMADRINYLPLESILDKVSQGHHLITRVPHVIGHINSATLVEGFIFVGLFETRIPQGRPAGGTILTAPGSFIMGPVPPGRYYMFAAALPKAKDLLSYLWPEPSDLLVGVSQAPITVRSDLRNDVTEVTLRPLTLTDPPLLVSLPFLLANQSAAQRALV
jgi:AraC family transcriptional regulator